MPISKLRHYSTWALILLPIFSLALEQAKVLDLGQHGAWVIPALSIIVGICKAIPQGVAAIEASKDAE